MTKTYKQLVDETLIPLIGKESKRDIISLIHHLYGVPQYHNMESSEALYEKYPVFIENMEGFEDWRVDNDIYGTNKFPQPGDIMYVNVIEHGKVVYDSAMYVLDVDRLNDYILCVAYDHYRGAYFEYKGPMVKYNLKTLSIITPPKNRIVPEPNDTVKDKDDDENEIVLIHPKTLGQIREAIHKMKLNVTDGDFNNCIISTLVPEGEILNTSRKKLQMLYEEMDKRIHQSLSIKPLSEDKPDEGTVVNLDTLFD